MRYFNDCSSLEGLKKAYRKFALELHPDKGGDPKKFVEMQNEYNVLLTMLPSKGDIIESIMSGTPAQCDLIQAEREYNRRVNILVNELGLTIILSNDWIWIKSDEINRLMSSSLKLALTLKLKIMNLGFNYSKRLDAWYWFSVAPAPRSGRSGKKMTLDEMFDQFGMELKAPKQI